MKRLLHLSVIAAVAFLSSGKVHAQNQPYFHEGFTNNPGSFNSAAPADATLAPTYQIADSGVWCTYGWYRTTGSACAGLDIGHLRSIKTTAGSGHLPWIVTPVVFFGINEFHFIPGADNNKTFVVQKTIDTLATNTNWTTIATFVAENCGGTTPDTTIMVNDANAKRIRILGQENYQMQIDSVWMTSTIPILPISFTSINAYQRATGVQVDWANATETNMAKYAIERSEDGRSFTEIASVTPTGNLNNLVSYSWFDASPVRGNNYYRIKAIEKDGNYKYSSLLKVAVGKTKTELIIAPNPVKGNSINLQIGNLLKGNYSVVVFNGIGQQVFNKTIAHEGGSATYQLQLPASVKAGIYNLQLKDGETIINKKVVIE